MAATWVPFDVGPGQPVRSLRSVQALTETPPGPTDAPDDIGMALDSIGAIAFYLDAGSGFTISADVGQVDIFVHDGGLWAKAPALALPVPAGSSGKRRVHLATKLIVNPRGKLAFFANGIQAGNTVVAIDAMATDRGGQK